MKQKIHADPLLDGFETGTVVGLGSTSVLRPAVRLNYIWYTGFLLKSYRCLKHTSIRNKS